MLLNCGLLFVILCSLMRLGWTSEGKATADMPTVMEANIHAMIDFRKEMLDNLQLSLEYHTEQLEEIKAYVEHKMQEQESRMTNGNELKFKALEKTLNAINSGSLFGGGWTVFQRRIDGSVDFHRDWQTYKDGFGDVNGEYWLGLEKLHIMTRSGRHELLVLVEDFEGNSAYALYDEFKIASEVEKYKLTVGKYSGTAGDSLFYHNEMEFSTFDQDNDGSSYNNAETYGAWWFGNNVSHLNGLYRLNRDNKQWGVGWNLFRYFYSLKSATMMFRSRASN